MIQMKKEDKVKEQPINGLETAEGKYNKKAALLRKSQEDYQTLLDTIPHGIQEIDTSGRIIFVNKAYNTIFGYEEGELIGTSILDKLVNDSKRDELSNYLKRLLKDQPTPTPFFEKNRTKKGRIIDVQVDWNYKRDNKGRIIGFISVLTNITERKKAEETLKKSETKYYNLIEHANDAIISINKAGLIIGFNKKAEELFGYSREEIVGKSSYLFTSQQHGEKQKKLLKQFAETGIILPMENKISEGKGLRKDGKVIDVEFSYYILDIHGEFIATSIVRDISERKMTEKKLNDYQKRLKSLTSNLTLTEEQERRRFAEFLHDDIGQQLFASQLQLELLKGSLSSSKNTKTLDKAINYIKNVIDQSRSLTFELSSPILHELGFEKALEWLAEQTHEKYDIRVVFKDDKQEKPLEYDVKTLLYQAVRELLINVAKHAQTKNASISVMKDNSNIRIYVKDQGVGFALPNKDFSDTKIEGFGLFRISERLNQLGGQIEIESYPNRGTQVTLVAPLSKKV
jgi:PAS domain S-box-containing protein